MRAVTLISLAMALMGAGEATPLNGTDVQTTSKVICNIPGYQQGQVILIDEIDKGISHLRGLSGNATLGHKEGGGWCWRYSCSYGSGIYACNDNQFDVDVPWSTLADYAQQLRDKCTFEMEDNQNRTTVQGQAFDSLGWNVIVGLKDGDDC